MGEAATYAYILARKLAMCIGRSDRSLVIHLLGECQPLADEPCDGRTVDGDLVALESLWISYLRHVRAGEVPGQSSVSACVSRARGLSNA